MTKLIYLTVTIFIYMVAVVKDMDIQVARSDSLQSIIKDKERIVERLAQGVNEAYKKRCSLNCTDYFILLSTCDSLLDLPHIEAISDFGVSNDTCFLIHHFQSAINVYTSQPYENKDTIFEKCWAAELDSTYENTYNAKDKKIEVKIRWLYFGKKSGLVRIFPHYIQPILNSTDPRVRPWYMHVSATKTKTIILVLDVSASMLNNGRLQLALAVAKTLVDTLTNVDYVGLILFGNKATQFLMQHQKPGQLLRATHKNKVKLQALIGTIMVDPTQSTNFEDAFEKAFYILDQVKSPRCNSAILFLTDGYPTKGVISEDKLMSLVKKRNTHGSIIFMYSIGSDSAQHLLRGIACANQGVYSHIASSDNLLQELSQYYEYSALLKVFGNDSSVSWVESLSHEDVAAGLLVTVSKAVFYYPIVVNRADMLVTDLKQKTKNGLYHEAIIQYLVFDNNCPTVHKESLRSSLLNIVRSKRGVTLCDESDLLQTLQKVPNCTMLLVDYFNYKKNRFVKGVKSHYFHQSCRQVITCTNKAINTISETFTLTVIILAVTILTAIL